jgi:hypothetical protein
LEEGEDEGSAGVGGLPGIGEEASGVDTSGRGRGRVKHPARTRLGAHPTMSST